MSRVDRYKCDGCGKELNSTPAGGQPDGWQMGWLASQSFHACTMICLVKAARAACDKLSLQPPVRTEADRVEPRGPTAKWDERSGNEGATNR